MRKLFLVLPLLLSAAALADPPAAFIPGTGLGSFRRATPQAPCSAAPYRQFDFWVGDWKVDSRFGTFTATNRVTVELDGCAVEEHWAQIGAPRGRSLNSYDAARGTWHQTWVPDGGRPFRMDGGLRADGVMAMRGVRVRPPPFFPWVDTYTWTPVTTDRVVQAFQFDVFEVGFHLEGFLTYDRAAELPAVETVGTNACQVGHESGENRLLDFTLGRYTIRAENGLELAQTEIALDPTLSGCLIEESIATPKGYRATGWLYYDSIENHFYRTVVDNEGNRLELHGEVGQDGFSMEGDDPADASRRLRLTWTPAAGGDLTQRWEVSHDGGATWREAGTLTYARR
jgi:hypothetical protein